MGFTFLSVRVSVPSARCVAHAYRGTAMSREMSYVILNSTTGTRKTPQPRLTSQGAKRRNWDLLCNPTPRQPSQGSPKFHSITPCQASRTASV